MKEIELTKGYVAIVDDEDYEWLSRYSWHAVCNMPYAAMRKSKYGKYYYMHRMILEKALGNIAKKHVDHINHNTLDNRRENLRLCSPSENLRNSKKSDDSATSKYKGTSYINTPGRRKRWRAYINIDGKQKHLGHFMTEKEAALEYNKAASDLFGDFANLNQV